ncbi:hypothetical protein D1007_60440 [Hordeum vulgare]|nr:hypothetical protein D1007_60440 [Hordeum vulgare]
MKGHVKLNVDATFDLDSLQGEVGAWPAVIRDDKATNGIHLEDDDELQRSTAELPSELGDSSRAKTGLKIPLSNAPPISSAIVTPASIEQLSNPQSEEDSDHSSPVAPARKVARKLWFEDTLAFSNIQLSSHIVGQFEYVPSSVVITEFLDDDSETQAKDNSKGYELTMSAMPDDFHASPSRKRSRRSKPITPLCTTEVRRSPCSNKYMGFKVDLPYDSHGRKSMIKPRVCIEITNPAPSTISESASSSSVPPPPPMTIKYIQQVGTGLCGIPSEELTEECLLAKGNDDEQ